MYCKKCNSLVENEDLICINCKYDNHAFDETIELSSENFSKPQKKQNNKLPISSILIIILVIMSSVIFTYVIDESKAVDSQSIMKDTTKINVGDYNKTFSYNNINLNYPEIFGASSNTIFYKNNNNYRITIKNISKEEYADIINSKDLLNSKLGDIETFTYAEDLFYSHVFVYQDDYYHITVNYINEIDSSIKSELSKIINTLH